MDKQFLIVTLMLSLAIIVYWHDSAYGSMSSLQGNRSWVTINDPNIKVETVFQGLSFPTSMAFLGPDDILVLEKNEGTVQRIVNGTISPHPLLDVNVSTGAERGMLGIAVGKNITTNIPYVFLYYTESNLSGNLDKSNLAKSNVLPLGNRLYRYELVNDKLVNPRLFLDLPTTPGPIHNGGKMVIGPDNNIYLSVGDLNSVRTKSKLTLAQNVKNGLNPDGRGGILRMSQAGQAVGEGILGDRFPLNLYYAYGIRNSFGIAFDPITKILWDTENGPNFGDEINLVKSGFNSGWGQVQGFWKPRGSNEGQITRHPQHLVDFGDKGKHQEPKFIWNQTAGPTGLSFLNSSKLGTKYKNEMFVGDFHHGRIYNFHLNEQRTGLDLRGSLTDKVANTDHEINDVVFGEGFGGITDIKTGPDGYLYVLAIHEIDDPKWYSADCDREKINNLLHTCLSFSASSIQGTIFKISHK